MRMKKKTKPGVRLIVGTTRTARLKAARQIAAESGTRLSRIDLDRVVGKYIGETEKNLAALFDRALRRGWILFFDEADALFGKRTEVKDSHDRYDNLEISHLLQRIESHPGLVILTCNRRDCLDAAVMRRLDATIQIQPDFRPARG
jgi:SpoVK/Ycf46/Vps4 family AAA+-type ATPase